MLAHVRAPTVGAPVVLFCWKKRGRHGWNRLGKRDGREPPRLPGASAAPLSSPAARRGSVAAAEPGAVRRGPATALSCALLCICLNPPVEQELPWSDA